MGKFEEIPGVFTATRGSEITSAYMSPTDSTMDVIRDFGANDKIYVATANTKPAKLQIVEINQPGGVASVPTSVADAFANGATAVFARHSDTLGYLFVDLDGDGGIGLHRPDRAFDTSDFTVEVRTTAGFDFSAANFEQFTPTKAIETFYPLDAEHLPVGISYPADIHGMFG